MRLRPTDAYLIAAVTAGLLLAAAAVVAVELAAGAAMLLDLVATSLEKSTHL